MIKAFGKAERVQVRRYESGRKGVAKAVRRFLARRYPEGSDFVRARLPVRWPDRAIKDSNAA